MVFIFKKYFKDTSNLLSFALALIPAILLVIFQPTSPVPYIIFAITVLLLILIAWIALKLYLDLKDVTHPGIILFKCSRGRCLCKPNPYLEIHSVVSFYKNENGFKEFLCHGYVETINDNGMVQIIVLDKPSFEYISTNQNDIIVKPTIDISRTSIEH